VGPELSGQKVVVTGASAGIGYGITKVLVKKGFHVFGSVRKQADGARLADTFGANVTAILFDVTDPLAVRVGSEQVAAALDGETLAGLVNNAGIFVPGPLLHLAVDDFQKQLSVNVTGHLIVTQAFAPLLAAAPDRTGKAGRIVMISSVGGKNAMPFTGAYNASKFAIEGLSESLRRELMLFGIDVIVVAPGAVSTPLWDKLDAAGASRFSNTPFAEGMDLMHKYMLDIGRKGLKPERVGRAVYRALTTSHPRTRYVVTPEKFENFMANYLPKRMIDRAIAARFALLPTTRR
jgi:NAD(P)-dependent dehydrogenase (short-subunit alcohol dehydrogenase family)